MKARLLSLWRSHSLVRYVCVGGVLFCVDVSVFMGLTQLGMAHPTAQLIARSVGAGLGFFGHKHLSFATDTQALDTKKQLMGYLAVTLVGIALSSAVIPGAIWLLGGLRFPGKVLGEACMVAVSWGLNRQVFKPHPSEPKP